MLWLAHHFPGLHMRPEDVDQLTPEQTDALQRVGGKLLKGEAMERLELTKIVARAASAGRVRF